jgi:hypothetical protein
MKLTKIFNHVVLDDEKSIKEDVQKIDNCSKSVHPSIKKHVEVLKFATNNFNKLSNWNERDIITIYLSIKSKDELKKLDQALACYLKHNIYPASLWLLYLTFQDSEVQEVRPVLVYLGYKLGQMDNIKQLFDPEKFKLV